MSKPVTLESPDEQKVTDWKYGDESTWVDDCKNTN